MHKEKSPYLLISILLYILLIWIPYHCFGVSPTNIQTLATVVGGLILLWYTWETMLIRQIANSQREIAIQPFVVLKNLNGKYYLENLGSGVALNVSVQTILKGDDSYRLEISFPKKIAVLRAQSEELLNPITKVNGAEVNNTHAACINPKYANEETEVNIRFSNVEGRVFLVKVIVSPNNLSIKKFQNNLIG